MKLSKNLNIFQGIGVVITTLLGSGIFIIPALSASLSGANSLFGWLLLSLTIIPIAYIFGILGNLYPHLEGSAYFVKSAFGKKLGKIIGIMYISIIPIGPPVVIITGASYLSTLFSYDMLLLTSLFMITIVFILNQYKFSISSNIGLIIVLLILLIILIITYFAFLENNSIKFTPINNDFFNSLGVMFWCFVGIEAISHLSSEFKNKNDFLKVVIFGTLIVGFLYTLVSFSVLKFNIYGDEIINFQSLILIFNKIIPIYGKIILSIIGFLICLIAVNLYVASTTRLLYSYTKEKLSFNINLILISLSISLTVILKVIYDIKIDTLILYANGVFVIIYLFVALSGVKLLLAKDRLIAIVSAFILCGTIWTIGLNILYALGVFLILFILNSTTNRRN